MRYTTVIDISEFPQVYRNHNARLVYLHLALKSGWHDADRDQIKTSIRRIAMEVGLTVSATRHALATLERDKLLTRSGDTWTVKKWIIQEIPTPRTQQKAQKKNTQDSDAGERYHREIEEWRQRVYKAVRDSSKEELQAWLKELTEGRRLTHRGVSIAANQDNIRWMQNVIDKL